MRSSFSTILLLYHVLSIWNFLILTCTIYILAPQLFLEIDDEVLKEIEIVFGPKMSEAEKIMAIALINEYCPKAIYAESVLNIR